ncbi:MAG: hypothetical protein ACR2Q4_24300 [Geminicoccaceae bacterium]
MVFAGQLGCGTSRRVSALSEHDRGSGETIEQPNFAILSSFDAIADGVM